MFGSVDILGQSYRSPFMSQSVSRQTRNTRNNPSAPQIFGSTTPFGPQTGSPIFRVTSNGVSAAAQSSTPFTSSMTFGASFSTDFGNTMSTFGASSTPAFSSSSSPSIVGKPCLPLNFPKTQIHPTSHTHKGRENNDTKQRTTRENLFHSLAKCLSCYFSLLLNTWLDASNETICFQFIAKGSGFSKKPKGSGFSKKPKEVASQRSQRSQRKWLLKEAKGSGFSKKP
ncbi:Nucleoporin autopeptidase, partial [Prunus dulcis]